MSGVIPRPPPRRELAFTMGAERAENSTAANLLAEAADSVARLAANATHEAAGVMSTEASAGSGEDVLSQRGMRGASRSGERGEAPSGAVVLTFIGGLIASQLLLYVRCGCMIKAYAHAPLIILMQASLEAASQAILQPGHPGWLVAYSRRAKFPRRVDEVHYGLAGIQRRHRVVRAQGYAEASRHAHTAVRTTTTNEPLRGW